MGMFDPAQYYSHILWQNGFDLDDKTGNHWGKVAAFATPLLAQGAAQIGQSIQARRSNNALQPKNFYQTLNSVTDGKKYQNFVTNASNLNKFQANPTYENAELFSKSYAGDRQQIFNDWTSGKLNTDQYLDSVSKLNNSVIQNQQGVLRSDYQALTKKYNNAANFGEFQNALNTQANLDIGAKTHFQVPEFNPPKPVTFEQSMQNSLDFKMPDFKMDPSLQQKLDGLNLDTTGTTNTFTPEATSNPASSTPSFASSIKTAGAGAAGGLVGSMGVSALGNALGANNSKGGQFATGAASQIVGQVGSTIGSNLANGANAFSNMGSSLGSAANIGQGAMGLANVALDVFDPVKKSKGENIANMVGGGVGLAASLAPALGLAAIPGVGWAVGGALLAGNIIGHAFGQKTESFTADKELLGQTNNSYGGSVNNIMTAQSLAGQKHSLWNNGGRHRDDEKIYEAKRQQGTLNNIIGYNNDRIDIAQANSGIMHTGREFDLAGGYNLTGTRVGKNGMVINKPTEITFTVPTKEFKEGGEIEQQAEMKGTVIKLVSPINEFQQGGSVNVIPDGSLHARKHNMDMEGITPKGIPVVSEKEGGEIEQQAEIEKEEIIFRLEVTKKLEELAKDGSDSAAIEAGKLLVEEILYNTVDKTNNLL